MVFGTELQGKESHDALLRLQDAEIRLLDNIKKCLSIRIDSDRKYAASLSAIVQCAQKAEEKEFNTYCTTFKTWETIVKQTEQFVKLLRLSVDDLSTKTLDKVQQVLTEKRSARKMYMDERNRIEQEFSKIQDEVLKQKQEYSKLLDKTRIERAKYEDLFSKGKAGSKLEDAKTRYQKMTVKLHKCHNDYVLSLQEVTTHQKCYLDGTLPTFLDYQQANQEINIQQCKDVFLDYQKSTNFASSDFQNVYKSMEDSIQEIVPETEYIAEFLPKFKTEPLQPITFEYDDKLLDDYKGTLVANRIALDDLTHETLDQRKAAFGDNIAEIKSRIENKESSQKELKKDLAELEKTATGDRNSIEQNDYTVKKRALEVLKKEISELQSCLSTKQAVYDLLNEALTELGDSVPPSAMEFPDMDDNKSQGSVGGGGGALESLKKKLTGVVKKSAPLLRDRDHSYEDSQIDPSTNGVVLNSKAEGGEPQFDDRELTEEDWFHGVLPREEVQRLLVEEGDYLVRESKNRKTNEVQYVLSACWDGYKHFIIQYADEGWRFEGVAFSTIQELLRQQLKSGQPVTSKSQTILKRAIIREDWELKNDDIFLEQKIGNGNFGEVYKGIFRPKNLTVAVKTCRDTLSEDQRKKFLMEGRILKQYDHPNIVMFIGIAAHRQPVMIVMEYVAGGALLNFLRKQGKSQTPRQLIKMCEDAGSGMAYLEIKKCIHRDLATRNCLVGDNSVVKISDFGMSREEEVYEVSTGMKQIPIKWTAPEALNQGIYTSLCDVWSFGIMMWEVFSMGTTPYPGMSNQQSREFIEAGNRMPAPEATPDSMYKLMLECWQAKPDDRPRFKEIHTRLKGIGHQYR